MGYERNVWLLFNSTPSCLPSQCSESYMSIIRQVVERRKGLNVFQRYFDNMQAASRLHIIKVSLKYVITYHHYENC